MLWVGTASTAVLMWMVVWRPIAVAPVHNLAVGLALVLASLALVVASADRAPGGGLSLSGYVKKWRYYASHVQPYLTKRGAVRRRVPTLVDVSIRQWRVAARDPVAFGGLFVLKVLEFGVIGWRLRFSRASSTPQA